MRIADILRIKGTAVLTARSNETLQAAAKRFRQEGVGALVVLGDGESLDGIITERDLCNGLALHGVNAYRHPISEVMTSQVITCSPQEGLANVARIMTERRLRHLPVKDGTRVVGVVSIGDILKYRLDEAQLENRVLRDVAMAMR
ncbi:MAG: CBS domain-containing protein [Hyphomicrobiaceae bacterium]